MARTRTVEASASNVVNSLVAGSAWAGKTITYAIATEAPDDSVYADTRVADAPAALREAVARAVAELESIIRVDLVEVPADAATIRIFAADRLALRTPEGVRTIELGGYAFFPGDAPEAGDVWLGTELLDDLSPGSFGYRTLLHELGHALGLKQPDEAGPYGRLPAHLDGPELSVMSGRTAPGAAPGTMAVAPGGHAQGFMTADIAALQHLYGAGRGAARDDRYVFDPAERFLHRTIWDGGGRDAYDFSAYVTPVAVDLRPGRYTVTGQEPLLNHAGTFAGEAPVWAKGAIHNASGGRRTLVEDAAGGAGSDRLVGNAAANRLAGQDGRDTVAGLSGDDTLNGGRGEDVLSGGAGADRLLGGAGDDRLAGQAGDDVVDGGDGRDRIAGAGGDDVLFGGSDADTLFGNGGDDVLTGAHGSDALLGGTGNDTLRGWGGNDRIAGGPGDDIIAGDPGRDRLRGGAGNDTMDGGAQDDALRGEDGSDVLSGGAGADALLGGAGDDILTGGADRDTFVFASGGGDDAITDFEPGVDRLLVPAPAAALASARDVAGGVLMVAAPGTTVFLEGLSVADLAETTPF